ncbi:MAG: hypothetical protein AVDCRST_MAG48-1227, partial [uncultured Friedmanniella sp.]
AGSAGGVSVGASSGGPTSESRLSQRDQAAPSHQRKAPADPLGSAYHPGSGALTGSP